MGKIVIVGSSNVDLIVKTARIPLPGETVMGGEFMMVCGGKGANQAVAVNRLGGEAVFVTRIGKDMFGDRLLAQYESEGMDTGFVIRDAETASGVAIISVDAKGENCIVVAPGANERLSMEDIDAAREQIVSADYVLMQMEIPLEVIRYVKNMAVAAGVKVILNPAPAAALDDDLLGGLFMITPNETECALITGQEVENEAEAASAARTLLSRGVSNVIVTMGSRGALVQTAQQSLLVPARRVDAVDTTAAGDVFNGAVAVALSEGRGIVEAVRMATVASSVSVTRMGAQPSVPTRAEVEDILKTI